MHEFRKIKLGKVGTGSFSTQGQEAQTTWSSFSSWRRKT